MSGPATISLIGQQLIPGDADTVEATADEVLRFGLRCATVRSELASVADPDWLGSAAEAFRTQLRREPARWGDAALAFETAGQALRSFALVLRDAQARAVRAFELYRHGEELTAQARAVLGPAAAAVDDPGEALRTRAIGQAASAEAEAAAAAVELERILIDAAIGAPDPRPASVSLGAAPGQVCANGPDGTCRVDHVVDTPVYAEDGHTALGEAPVPAGTMIPTAGLTDRQTDSEPIAPGRSPLITWQDGVVDAAYVRTHDISAEIGLPVMVAVGIGTAMVDDVKNAIEHPSVGHIAMVGLDFAPVGKLGDGARAIRGFNDARRVAEQAEVATRTAMHRGFEIVGEGTCNRVIQCDPTRANPNWGLTTAHLEKHLTGSGRYSLSRIDPDGDPTVWAGYLRDLAGRPATATLAGGMEDIIGTFPRTGGGGTFEFGIRIASDGRGGYHLVTLLTRQ